MEFKGKKFVVVGAGISGIGAIPDLYSYQKTLEEKFNCPITLFSDAELELRSIMKDKKEGLICVAGTGNATIAIKDGTSYLAGGGGPLLGEEGSSYSCIQKLTMRIKTKYEMGLSYNPLEQKILQAMNCKNFPDLKAYFYQHTKTEIARFAKKVIDEAAKNDPDALLAIDEQAFCLVRQVKILVDRLNIENGAILGLYGGFTKQNSYLLESFKKYLTLAKISLSITQEAIDLPNGCYIIAMEGLYAK